MVCYSALRCAGLCGVLGAGMRASFRPATATPSGEVVIVAQLCRCCLCRRCLEGRRVPTGRAVSKELVRVRGGITNTPVPLPAHFSARLWS